MTAEAISLAAHPDDAPPQRPGGGDFSDQKHKRVFMREHAAAPVDALMWPNGDGAAAAKQFRAWRTACFWKFRRQLVVRSLVAVLPDYAVMSGYAYPSNDMLASKVVFLSKKKIDRAWTAMERGGAIIRRYVDQGGGAPWRRIYLAKAVIDEFEKASSEM